MSKEDVLFEEWLRNYRFLSEQVFIGIVEDRYSHLRERLSEANLRESVRSRLAADLGADDELPAPTPPAQRQRTNRKSRRRKTA